MFKRKFYLLTLASVMVAFGLAMPSSLYANVSQQQLKETARLKALEKFTRVVNIVQKYYVNKESLNTIINKSLKGLMTNLDPHSAFLIKQSYKNLQTETSGEFGGLGISVGMKSHMLTVIAPIQGTPAYKAGIKPGDIILMINNKSTIGMNINNAVKLMRGKIGTPINITVYRKGAAKPIKIHIIRGLIKIQSVYTRQIGKNILYIKITSFDQHVVPSVKKALNKYGHTDKGIVLDLRNNPGGLLNQAVGLVNMFVKHGIIVSQKGRLKSEDEIYKANPAKFMTNLPIVVLINGGTASAAEITSGALQDHKRAIIIGQKSFGKGSVQVVLPIAKDQAVKLTIARYYLPSGRTIQNIGITPDVEVKPGEIKTYKGGFDIKEVDLQDHLKAILLKDSKQYKLDHDHNKSIKKKDSNKKIKIITQQQLRKDAQLQVAVDIMKALIITKGTH